MKYDVVWTHRSMHQLRKLYRYVALEKKEPLSAVDLYDGILEFGDRIGESPKASTYLGKKRGKGADYWCRTYKGSHRLIYWIDEKSQRVVIAALFHNSADPASMGF